MSEIAEAIRGLAEQKEIGIDEVKVIVENMIKAAYKKAFGSNDNCIVELDEDYNLSVYSKKLIVETAYREVDEIEYDDSVNIDPSKNIGDYIMIPIDPKNFGRLAVDTGKQNAHQALNDTHKDFLYNMHKGKVGSLISGKVQRELKGNVYVDLSLSDVEGILPKKNQSPAEVYDLRSNLCALVTDIKKLNVGVQLILSRSDPKLVEKILERDVVEIKDGTVEIYGVAREAGKKTKIAVLTKKEGVDPVGACVGLKGARIGNVIKELMNEKIDVIRYEEDPHKFIAEALTPAKVEKVVLTDMDKREAVAIVKEDQFSFAVGRFGLNVKLANKLCNWSIDVKTEAQAAELDISEDNGNRKAAEALFNTVEAAVENEAEDEEITNVSQLPGIESRIADILKEAGIDDIGDFVEAVEDGRVNKIEGLSAEDIETVNKVIEENVEFEDAESTEVEQEEEEEYFCPECGAKISLNDSRCPSCGIELVFE